MKKKFTAYIVSIMIIISSLGIQAPVYAADTNSNASTNITIFHTNDMHSRVLDAFKNNVLTQIGSDYVSTIKKSVPNSLLIDAGDATQGLPFATLTKGADVINLMNAAGYDGMVLGNHEFDYGQDNTLANAKLANFPVISANTIKNGKPFLEGVNENNGCDFIKTVNGIKVGFFGVTTQETSYKTNPSNIIGITFEDPIATSKAEVAKLKSEGASVIIAITHIGNDPSSNPTSSDIAKNVDGINVIIDGHSHTLENTVVNNTLIVQTVCYSANLGRLDINVSADGKVTAAENMISAADATKYTPDSSVSALATQINAKQTQLFSTKVGHTSTAFWAGTVNNQSVARIDETNLGDLVADAMKASANSQVQGTEFQGLPIVALENGGGVRDSIPEGDITAGQISTILPFGNILSLKEVTPAILYGVIENGVSKVVSQDQTTGVLNGADGRFPQISGIRFEYDPTKPSLNRVNKIYLLNADGSDKQLLDKNDTTTKIVLASNDYEVSGGDGYTMLGTLKNIGEGASLDGIVDKYISGLTQSGNGTFSYPMVQGRSKVVSNYVYKPYTASITLVGSDSKNLANASVLYAIDKGTVYSANTDANGLLKISNIPSGSHTVSILTSGAADDVYISDLIGSGTSSPVSAALQVSNPYVAEKVTDIINNLPSKVTLTDKTAVSSARSAYNLLTPDQKTLVANCDKLTTAETAINSLNTPAATNTTAATSDPEKSNSSNSNVTTSSTAKLPQTGSFVDNNLLIDLGTLLSLLGVMLFVASKKYKNKKCA